jgi:hypothetical protein
MKNIGATTIVLCLLALGLNTILLAQDTSREFYQLKVYTLNNGDQEQRLDAYLETALIPALHRQGLKDIGVFKQHPNKFVLANKVYVLIPFTDIAVVAHMEDKLQQDAEFMGAGARFWDAPYDNPPFERVNTIVMRAFSEMSKMKPSAVTGPKADRVYELRNYESPTDAKYWNKVDMFNAGGEVALFADLGFNAVFYAEVLAGDRMPNLMYMTTFPNMEKRDALWEAFFSSEKWTALKNDEKYKNNMKKAEVILLYPTAYSEY